jgi:hypothetical protein
MLISDAVKIVSAYSLALIIVGTAFNLLSFCICSRKKLSRINTFKLIMFSSVADIISLYGWLLRHFMYTFFNFDMHKWTLFWCRFSDFYQYCALQYSSWILVILRTTNLCFTIKSSKPKGKFLELAISYQNHNFNKCH